MLKTGALIYILFDFLIAGESISAATVRITFTLNVGYNDGCENGMSPQRMLQLTSSIRPVTQWRVCKDLSCVWEHSTVVLYSVGHNRQRTKGQGRSRWMWLMSHAEVWHHAHGGTKVMWILYVVLTHTGAWLWQDSYHAVKCWYVRTLFFFIFVLKFSHFEK